MNHTPNPDSGLRAGLKRAYHRLLTLSTGGKGVRKTAPDGESFFVRPQFRYLDWNPVECAAYRKRIQPGDTVLDIGANAGAYALLFGKWVQPGGRVFAFEPAGAAFQGLSEHVAINDLNEAVTSVQAAVSDRAGTVRFLADGFQGTNRLLREGETSPHVSEVPAVTVDEFCRERGIRPTFWKIDTEGYELAVLRGARETVRQAGARLAIFMELHPTQWARQGFGAEAVRDELAQQGLEVTWVPEGVDPWTTDSGVTVEIRPKGAA
ncbi:MAG: FkbM family methyltransferase [Verrucomicrobiota bacterium]